MSNIINATKATFREEVLKSDVPVLVDFWAPWCGPCRVISPVVEELANEMAGRLKVVKVNTDENTDVSSEYGIMSIPTLGIFMEGEMIDTVVGALPKTQIMQRISPYLSAIN